MIILRRTMLAVMILTALAHGSAIAAKPKPAARPDASPQFRKLVATVEACLKCKVTYHESAKGVGKVVILCPEEHSDNSDTNQANRLAILNRACGIDCLLLESVPADPACVKSVMQRTAEVMRVDEPFDHDYGVPEAISDIVEGSEKELKARRELLLGKGSYPIIGIETADSLFMGQLICFASELNQNLIELWGSGAFDDGTGLPGDPKGPAGGVVQLIRISNELLKLAPEHFKPIVKDIVLDPVTLVLARKDGKDTTATFLRYNLAWNSYVILVALQGRNGTWMAEPIVKNALANPSYKRLALIAGAAHLDKKEMPGTAYDLRDLLQKKGISWILLPSVN